MADVQQAHQQPQQQRQQPREPQLQQGESWLTAAGAALRQLSAGTAHERETGLTALTALCSQLPQEQPTPAADAQAVDFLFEGLAAQILGLLPGSKEEKEKKWEEEEGPEAPLPHPNITGANVVQAVESGTSPAGPTATAPPSGRASTPPGVQWEPRQAAFLGARVALDHWHATGAPSQVVQGVDASDEGRPTPPSGPAPGREPAFAGLGQDRGGEAPAFSAGAALEGFCEAMGDLALDHLDDPEPRVRLAVAECMAGLSLGAAPRTVSRIASSLLHHIDGMLLDPRCTQRYIAAPDTPSGSRPRDSATACNGPSQADASGSQGRPEGDCVSSFGEGKHQEVASHEDPAHLDDAPSSPKSDSDGLLAAMSWAGGPAGGLQQKPDSRTGPGALRGFHGRPGSPNLHDGPGRSLETSVRAVQQLLEGLKKRQTADRAKMGRQGSETSGAGSEASTVTDMQTVADNAQLGRDIALRAWPTLLQASPHPNRFVREASFFALASVFPLLDPASDAETVSGKAVPAMATALGDNWSQVRYAASVAVRQFVEFVAPRKKDFFPALLPAMAFNRYYGAEGVRIYSQATWQMAMGISGRQEVARHIDAVIAFYLAQSSSGNFMARETACLSIREVVDKIERQALLPYVPRLLEAVSRRHEDVFWPVRVAACSASHSLVTQYPGEVELRWGPMSSVWRASLLDSMPTVRQDSATVFGAALRSMRPVALPACLEMIREMLPRALSQEAQHGSTCTHSEHGQLAASDSCHKEGGIRVLRLDLAQPGKPPETRPVEPSTSIGSRFTVTCGTVKAGSVPPALGSSSAELPEESEKAEEQGDGVALAQALVAQARSHKCNCASHRDSGPSLPNWVPSEAAVLLLKELSSAAPEEASEFMPQLGSLADACAKARGGAASSTGSLLTTLWHFLPNIARGVGKRKFKAHLDAFLEPLFVSLAGETSLSSASSFSSLSSSGEAVTACAAAASQCISQLQLFVGPSIFEGRLSAAQRQLLAIQRSSIQHRQPSDYVVRTAPGAMPYTGSFPGTGTCFRINGGSQSGPAPSPGPKAAHWSRPLAAKSNVVRECFQE